MKINLTMAQKNIIQIILLLSIGIFCDVVFMGILGRFVLPEQSCTIPDIYNTSKIYRTMYNNLPVVYSIFCTIYIILLKIYLFPKIVTIIENDKSEISFLIQNIHKNKQVILYIIIFLMFCSFVFNEILSDIFYVNKTISYIFSLPFNYIVLYLYWFFKDICLKNKKEKIKTDLKKDIITHTVKYVLITNSLTIICVVVWIGLLFLSNL